MKRSEMLEILSHKLTLYDDYYTNRKAKELVHLLLNEIVMLGMLPPKAEITKKHTEGVLKGVTLTEKLNEWEPEDA